jgi:hypothetical protein
VEKQLREGGSLATIHIHGKEGSEALGRLGLEDLGTGRRWEALRVLLEVFRI